jgi:hypothetical protein
MTPKGPLSRRRRTAATLAAILERDLLRTEPARTSNAVACLMCGRPFTPRPDTDDTRFCWAGCYEAFHIGLPPYNPDQLKKLSQMPFTAGSNLRVVAGPPGVASFDPFKGSMQLSRGIRRRGSSGWVIECFGCGAEFDSKGSRCCSAVRAPLPRAPRERTADGRGRHGQPAQAPVRAVRRQYSNLAQWAQGPGAGPVLLSEVSAAACKSVQKPRPGVREPRR